ncbi:LysR family transcriptional regulator [Kribbella italica]|uniref:DNA-binding transcriptional LysR family regulator n=1 Tax=Kribbella italica TaxID=1540520 RepID=A0A7W9MTH3_9ACTN|nr:LysR family transcriptional regulator [Kribbella italica]MBB5835679.1 DNA-binding transcriptional LysR family regulator [Kribbella italica]
MAVSLQQLEMFRAVARNLSFSVAAREAYTSQPHVSNQIRKLEQHYGIALFVRSRPGITLTEAGAALYERIDKILADLEGAEQLIQQFRGLRRGSVRLAATSSVGNHVLPALIADFQREHHEITVSLRVSNTEQVWSSVEADEAELAVTPLQPPSRELTYEPFTTDDLVVAAPAGMELPDVLTVAALAGLPLVAREDGSLTLNQQQELLKTYDTTVVAQLSGTTAVNEAVAAGAGVSLVPESAVRAWVDAGLLKTRRLSDVTPQHEYFLVYSPQRHLAPATRALIEHLRAARQLAIPGPSATL